MAGAKFVVLYPMPKDVAAFEKVYLEEHVPMAVENLKGKSKIVASKPVESVLGKPAIYRYVEVHYPSMEALQASLASPGAKKTAEHAVKISSGGAPTFLIAEEQVFEF
ncbi:MAG: EthD family reductase [Candidatus Acidiferrales bacterium]